MLKEVIEFNSITDDVKHIIGECPLFSAMRRTFKHANNFKEMKAMALTPKEYSFSCKKLYF